MWGALYRVNALFCAEKTASQQAGDTEQQVVEYVKEHLTDPDLSLKDLEMCIRDSHSMPRQRAKRSIWKAPGICHTETVRSRSARPAPAPASGQYTGPNLSLIHISWG